MELSKKNDTVRASRRTLEQRRKYESYYFVLPGLLLVLLVQGYPLIYNIVLSLKNMNKTNLRGGSVFIGFTNFSNLITDPKFQRVFTNTVVFTVFCLLFQFTLGMLLALFFAKKSKVSSAIRGLCMIPYLMPMSVTALLWQNIFTGSAGFMNDLLMRLGLISTVNDIPWLQNGDLAMTAVIIANCWVGIPFNMLLLANGLANVPTDIYESASVDGANRFQKFFKITVPMIKPAMLSVLIMGCIYTFKCFDLQYVMTSGGPVVNVAGASEPVGTHVMGTYAYKLSFTNFEFSQGAACSVILFAVLLCVGLVYLKVINTED